MSWGYSRDIHTLFGGKSVAMEIPERGFLGRSNYSRVSSHGADDTGG